MAGNMNSGTKRKKVHSVDKKDSFIKYYREFEGNITTICNICNVTRDVFYHLKKTDSDFVEKLEEIDKEIEDRRAEQYRRRNRIASKAENSLENLVEQEKEQSVHFALKKLKKEIYGDEVDLNLKSKDSNISFNIISASEQSEKTESDEETDDV